MVADALAELSGDDDPADLLGGGAGRSVAALPRSLGVLAGVGVLAYLGFLVLHIGGAAEIRPGTYGDFLGNIGRSFIGSALLIVVGDRLTGMARGAVSPLTAVGSLSLSAYVLQVLTFVAILKFVDFHWLTMHWWLPYLGVPLVVVAGCWCWHRLAGRGPLERLLRLLTSRVG